MSDMGDRRARKKALTREQIRTAAQDLFAEHGFDSVTIADVAASADVAVQTVFNHFPTKEELFFDGRTPWVDQPAEAVRARNAGQRPLAALRGWTSTWITAVGCNADEERRSYLATMSGSPTLRAYELSLLERAEQRLAAALAEAWSESPVGGPHPCGADINVRMAANLTAALWVAGARTLSVELRAVQDDSADAAAVRRTVAVLSERLFDRLERGLRMLLSLPDVELSEPALNLPGPTQARQGVRRAG